VKIFNRPGTQMDCASYDQPVKEALNPGQSIRFRISRVAVARFFASRYSLSVGYTNLHENRKINF
jgi:hypothetical protein